MKNSTSREVANLEAAMAERPPVIVWRLDPIRRVQVALCIDDPYAEHGERTECKHGHPLTEDNLTPQGRCRTCKNERERNSRKPPTAEQRRRRSELERQRRQQNRQRLSEFAADLAERTRKPAEDSPLMAAARTEL